MGEYLGNFIEHPGQMVALAGVAVVWAGLAAVGGVLGGRDGLREVDPLYGWGLAAALFTLAGVFTAVPFMWLAGALAVLAVAAAIRVVRRDGRLVPASALRMVVLTAPLILAASAMVGSQWDEFSQWLPSTRFLLQADRFPGADMPATGASFPAYPYGWPLLGYLAGRVGGQLIECAGPLFNILLLLTFGLVTIRVIRRGLADGADADAGSPGWGLCALGALAATLFNPTFVPKIALTAYADTATTVATGIAAVLGWLMLEVLGEGRDGAARRLAWQAGLVLTLLVTLKQAAVVLFVMVAVAVVLAGWRDPAVRLGPLVRLLPAVVLPPLVVYVAWRYHVSTGLGGREFVIRPVSTWFVGEIPQILGRMLLILSKKGVYLGIMALAVAFAVRGLVRFRGPFDRLSIIVGLAFLGYNTFLLFAYVASFRYDEAVVAASFWRYNMHLGGLCIVFAAYGLAVLWRRHGPDRLRVDRLGWLAVALLVAAPLALPHKLRFDRQPPTPHIRAVGQALADLLPPGGRVAVVDTLGSGESSVITAYELREPGRVSDLLAGAANDDPDRLRAFMAARRSESVVVYSVSPAVQDVLGPAIMPGATYLLTPDNGDGRSVVRAWPVSADR